MKHRVIIVTEPEIIKEGIITTYKLYTVRSKKIGQDQFDTEVNRRYSDFEWLYNQLIENYGGYFVPLLPEKNFFTKFNIESQQFYEKRRNSLEKFLNKILSHEFLR